MLVVHLGLGYSLPIWPALLMVGASALVNLWATVGRPAPARLGDREVAFYLGFDLLQLAGLLYLTGGLNNPFAVLILAPVTVSATVLSRASTIALSLIALAVVALLPFFHLPLPWPDVVAIGSIARRREVRWTLLVASRCGRVRSVISGSRSPKSGRSSC